MDKIKRFIFVSIALIAFIAVGCQKAEYEVPLIPLEDFFKNPQNTHFELSPNGEFIASLKPWKNRLNIFIQKVGEDSLIQITKSETRDIAKFFWANDRKILFLQDIHNNDHYSLFCTNIMEGKSRELTNSKNSTTHIIDDLSENEDEIIIQTNERDPKVFDVYRLNLISGKKKVIAQNPGNITHWLTDFDGKLRVAMATDGVNHSILYRKRESDKLKIVKKINFKDKFYPIQFTPDNKYIYVISDEKGDRTALIRYDIERNYELEVVYEHPEVDIEYVRYSKKKRDITGVSVITSKREFNFWDEARRAIQINVEKKLPNMEISVESTDEDEKRILIKASSDKSYGAYYLYETENDKLTKIAEISPWLDPSHMADMKPIRYISRDGLTIHGYLTLPRISVIKDLPVVVFPHGGPWLRDKWGFNEAVQFYANRGYAVLQVNYRGSSGYGKKFLSAGYKEWGGKIQNDITDGVRWLINQGIVDSNRIGIVGYSFGGYSALQGLVSAPDLYACSVSLVGISDILSFLETIPPTWIPFKKMLYEIVGDPIKDKEQLINASPYWNIDKIKAPMFIAQGANDTKVKISQVDDFVKKLLDKGVTVQYMVKDNEGHGFRNEENRIDFYRETEKFLAKYLKGRKERK
ncbi:MAG: S9 family peptidase [Bacteroidota bacterium]